MSPTMVSPKVCLTKLVHFPSIFLAVLWIPNSSWVLCHALRPTLHILLLHLISKALKLKDQISLPLQRLLLTSFSGNRVMSLGKFSLKIVLCTNISICSFLLFRYHSEILQEYGIRMMEISNRVIKIMLMILGADCESKFYESAFSKCHGYLRIVNYTPPETVEQKEVEGLGMHTDMSCITVVYQDETGGLQMRSKDGKWIDINPCANSLVVNIGDLMQAWTNGRLRSSEHRVVLKRPVNRLSMAFFWCFEDDKLILAPDEVVGDGCSRKYKAFTCLHYLKFRVINEVGKFDRIAYTVKDFAGIQ